MVLFAPWQLNVLFYVWLAAAVLRTQSKIKRAEEAAIAKTTADRDQNVAELKSYRAAHHKAAQEANRNAHQDKQMKHEQDKQDKQMKHQQDMQDKQDKLDKQDKQDKLDKIAQRKSTEQVTAERKFVTRKNILFK
jgi:hypothetical protein